jgi:hypothetical protein
LLWVWAGRLRLRVDVDRLSVIQFRRVSGLWQLVGRLLGISVVPRLLVTGLVPTELLGAIDNGTWLLVSVDRSIVSCEASVSPKVFASARPMDEDYLANDEQVTPPSSGRRLIEP